MNIWDKNILYSKRKTVRYLRKSRFPSIWWYTPCLTTPFIVLSPFFFLTPSRLALSSLIFLSFVRTSNVTWGAGQYNWYRKGALVVCVFSSKFTFLFAFYSRICPHYSFSAIFKVLLQLLQALRLPYIDNLEFAVQLHYNLWLEHWYCDLRATTIFPLSNLWFCSSFAPVAFPFIWHARTQDVFASEW